MNIGEAASRALDRVAGRAENRVSLTQLYEALGGKGSRATRIMAEAAGVTIREAQRWVTQAGQKRAVPTRALPLLNQAARGVALRRMAQQGFRLDFIGDVIDPSGNERPREVRNLNVPPGTDGLGEFAAAGRMGDEETFGAATEALFFSAWGMDTESGFAIGEVRSLVFRVPPPARR